MKCGQVVLVFFLLATTLVVVKALKCYQCESHLTDGCHPLDKSLIQLTDCPPEAKSCTFLKMDAQFKYAEGEKQEPRIRYIRGCSNEEAESEYTCIERAGTGANTKNTYCSCNTDGCNPAGRITMMGSGVIVALGVLISYLA